MLTRVRGTQDSIDLSLQNYVLSCAKEHFEQFNFHEIQTPLLEHTALFTHALGEATDVVSKEMYTFSAAYENDTTASSEKSICLRPEATAAVVRACYENRIDRFPWKVFLYGPMFRRERPQKGRLRQFHQINLEIIGSNAYEQDVMLIKMLDRFFSDKMKLNPYVIKLNFLGCSADRKRHKDALLSFLNEHQTKLCATCVVRKDANTLRVFDCKNEHCQALYKQAPLLVSHLCESCGQEWANIKVLLHLLGVSYVEDSFLVRGLDYYNKIVFEFVSHDLGSQSAFCGGGRYQLGKHVGASQDYDAVGVGIGMERLIMLIEASQQPLLLPEKKPLVVILPLAQEQVSLGLIVLNDLLIKGVTADIVLDRASTSNMMKKANKMGATFVLFLGEQEQQTGTIMIKNMTTGTSITVSQLDIVPHLK